MSRQACRGGTSGHKSLDGRFSSLTRPENFIQSQRSQLPQLIQSRCTCPHSFRDALTSGQEANDLYSLREGGQWVGPKVSLRQGKHMFLRLLVVGNIEGHHFLILIFYNLILTFCFITS